jgi:integrase
VADAGIPDPRPRLHDARHHWAIFMLRAGVQPQVIAKVGGWGSLSMLNDRYGKHALPGEDIGSGAALDAYLASQRTG